MAPGAGEQSFGLGQNGFPVEVYPDFSEGDTDVASL